MVKQSFSNYFFVLLSSIVMAACAKVGSPTGGDKDVDPPKIIKSQPENLSLNIQPKEIRLDFDEYVVLGNPDSEWIISPPLKSKPKVKIKGKSLIIVLPDSLEENTTYSINFAESIKDLHEGNLLKENLYIFSTGSFIDSGVVAGKTYSAYKDEPIKDIAVGLYLGFPDSIPPKTVPRYYGKSDESGNFKIPYLKDSTYFALAWEDKNNNKLLEKTEKRAFASKLIRPTSNDSLILRVFESLIDSLSIEKESLIENKKVKLQFNGYPLSTKLSVEGDSIAFIDRHPDSLIVWYSQERTSDSVVLNIQQDAFSERLVFFPFAIKKRGEQKLKLATKIFPSLPTDSLSLLFSEPLSSDSLKITYVASGDSIPKTLIARRDKNVANKYVARNPIPFGKNVKMDILPLTSIYQKQSDTISFNYSIGPKESFGNFSVKLSKALSSSQNYFFLFGSEQSMKKYPGTPSGLKIKNLSAGNYLLFLVLDKDGNGEYSTGDLLNKLQPERVIKFKQAIEIRANWDLDLSWDLGN